MWTVGHLARLPDKAATEKMKDGRLSTDVVDNEHVLYMDAGMKAVRKVDGHSRVRLHGGIQLKFYADYRHLPNADPVSRTRYRFSIPPTPCRPGRVPV